MSMWTAIGLCICAGLVALMVWGIRGGDSDMEGY